MPDRGRRWTRRGPPSGDALHQTFEAIVIDWDGTAVPDREPDPSRLRLRIEALCAAGVHVVIVTNGHVRTVDERLRARPRGRGGLHICCNRGSEVFAVDGYGPRLVLRRTAGPEDERALDRAAESIVDDLRAQGFQAGLASSPTNGRTIETGLAPPPADPGDPDVGAAPRVAATPAAPAAIVDAAEVVAIAADACLRSGLSDPRITRNGDHLGIGLTDRSDSARWAADWLARQGITGGLVLVAGGDLGSTGGDSLMVDAFSRAVAVSVGSEPGDVPSGAVHLDGGPARLLGLLDEQRSRRAGRRVPNIDLDPTWVVPLPTTRAKERVAEALGALGNGLMGVRASRDEDGGGAAPLVLVNGVFTSDGHLLPGPNWAGLERPGVDHRHTERRLLDLRGGTLVRIGTGDAGERSLRFVSLASPHAMALRAEAPEARLRAGDPISPPSEDIEFEREQRGDVVAGATSRGDAEIVIAVRDRVVTVAGRRVVERVAAWDATPAGTMGSDSVYHRIADVEALGFDALLAGHRLEWARRWEDAQVVIEGDPGAELAARFAVFHLLSAAGDTGETAVGARGLTGQAYAGHVFWDADVFVLPVLAAIRPAAARAMLEYRIRRLPAARAAADAQGLHGARFPWESAGDGSDVTPRLVRGENDELIPIATGLREEHIVADVAWSAAHYSSWTGDTSFLEGAGGELLIDTARYWASRIQVDTDGVGHLRGVMGPDEYHEVVDDNAYTNVMARWNLRRGAELLFRSGEPDTAATWRTLAQRLYDGWSPERGIYEQFAGYFELEPLLMPHVAAPPVAADVLLGADRVAGSQLIKQLDVLMLHHLVPEEVVEGSLKACLDFYGPRTAHGSSLSPAVHASLLARAGEPERALQLFRLAARLDLDDLTGTTAEGLHLATLGGVWQALAFGFLGVRAELGTLAIRPCLPKSWRALGLTFRFQGVRAGIRAEHDRVTVTCDAPLVVRVDDRAPARCRPGTTVIPSVTTTRGDHR
jgi:trehalose/maltose hydrolase-like predicted phosphorylase